MYNKWEGRAGIGAIFKGEGSGQLGDVLYNRDGGAEIYIMEKGWENRGCFKFKGVRGGKI